MPTLWVDTLLSEDVGAGGSRDAVFLGVTGLTSVERRLARRTLIRTIIRVDLAAAVRDSGEGDQIVDVGICMVAAAQSVVADIADPAIETDYPALPWIYRARFRVYAVAVDDQNVHSIAIDKDLRSQRKVENGKLVWVTTNTDNLGVATAVTLKGIVRQLFLI